MDELERNEGEQPVSTYIAKNIKKYNTKSTYDVASLTLLS